MEGLSIAANGLAVVSVAFQLTEACIKLYKFWESVEDAPQDIAAIKEDLQYLISIFNRIESNSNANDGCIAEGLQHCRIKVGELTAIVEKFDVGLHSQSRKIRKWSAFKAANQTKHIGRFRASLSETKATLTLALVHQCVVQSQQPTYTVQDTNTYGTLKCSSLIVTSNRSITSEGLAVNNSLLTPLRRTSPVYRKQCGPKVLLKPTSKVVKGVLKEFEKSVSEQAMTNASINELMLHAIGQTAVANFESDSLEIFAQDGYTIDSSGAPRSRTFVYAENLRYRVRHHASHFRTALGCVWIRKTIIILSDEAGDAQERSQCITSFVFYPTKLIQQLGVRNGLEAVMASAGRSWLFNCRLTVTRAVPEDSLIFELCRNGQTRAVEILLSKQIGSVVDTSPKGWKPLHFAVAGGHVDLCTMLIEAGADKTALVYEGLSASILSPISIFVACASELHAEVKIAMLRLFSDCIDLADSNGDGWTVHEWLKKTYARERVPISQNSITWLLQLTAKEEYVEFTSRRIWSALQHAVRTVLCHQRHSRLLERILGLSSDGIEAINEQLIDAIGLLMAFRVSGRRLLPMVVTAGSFLQIPGFDWATDDMTYRQYLQALPTIYTAWCHALLDCVENVEDYMRLEFDQYLQQLGWSRDSFLVAVSQQCTPSGGCDETSMNNTCTRCESDYSILPGGLIAPTRIAVSECIRTGHSFNCDCEGFYTSDSVAMQSELQDYTGVCLSGSDIDVYIDETFHDAELFPHYHTITLHQETSDTFSDAALLLYRAQGRAWTGSYAIEEQLCATCFLLKEHYTDEDGRIADFPPMPSSYNGLRFTW